MSDPDQPHLRAAPPGDDPSDDGGLHDLTDLVLQARRGVRSAVAPLVAALERGALFVPLAKAIADVPLGQAVRPDEGELTLSPHLLPERDGVTFVPLFSDPDVLRTVGQYLDWTTLEDGQQEELQYCTLPARVALELAQQLVDGKRVQGAVINPSDETELLLQRHEIGAFCQSQPIPLVGYVSAIATEPGEKVLVAELLEPPSAEVVTAIESCLAGMAGVLGYRLQQTFNAERDLEPHPSLTIELGPDHRVDTTALGERLFSRLEGRLPEPGYIDVLFEVTGGRPESGDPQ